MKKEKLNSGNIYIQDNEYKAMLLKVINNRLKMIYLHNGIIFMTSNLKNDGFELFDTFKENPTLDEIKERMNLIEKGSYI